MRTLCRVNDLSCFGCCVGKWVGEDAMMEGIKENTRRDKQLDTFFNKGVCQHTVKQGRHYGCRIHEAVTGFHERRHYHKETWFCDTKFQCRTNKEFMRWSEKKQEDFLNLVKSKKLSSYEYSEQIFKGTLLKEFKRNIY